MPFFIHGTALHHKARELGASPQFDRIITTEMVLAEVMNDLGACGPQLRKGVATFVAELRNDPEVSVVPQSSEQFWNAAKLFRQRADKEWSLTDCVSCLVMQELGITEALTHDRHFEQMGFRALLREP